MWLGRHVLSAADTLHMLFRAKDGEVHATPLLQHFETELPFNREPLSAAVGKLQAEPNAQCPESGWQDLRLADLHPASW